jgi:ribonuclease P protein component
MAARSLPPRAAVLGRMTATPDIVPPLRHLLKRKQFLRAARGNRAGRAGIGLQAAASDHETPGVGFTVTKKVGNAPARNRIKRRLRAAVRSCAGAFEPRHDYVLVGRRETLGTPFATLVADLNLLLGRIHTSRARLAGTNEPDGSGT